MRGFAAQMVDGTPCYTHGSFASRDSLIGPLYLILQEVLEASEPMASDMLHGHQELFTLRNAAFSQPYYTRHDYAHLRRGEVKAFLKTFYNQVAALADRETYTFWEHYFHASPHKTHEEAWFLMQLRWMLYLEESDTLRLLGGIPRAWLADGQRVQVQDMASYFGAVSFSVESDLKQGRMQVAIRCEGRGDGGDTGTGAGGAGAARRPRRVEIRLPHPLGQRTVHASAGRYDAESELVILEPFNGEARFEVRFG
jgi:hypothetical protein